MLINKFSNLSINQQVHMGAPVVKYFFCPFEGNKNTGYPQGLKLYLQATKYIYKESGNLDISVSNAKDILDNFLSIDNKYGWVLLLFMVGPDAGTNKIFRQVEQIHIADIHY